MQVTINGNRNNRRLSVRVKRSELRRLFGLLFVLTVVPPIVWGVGTRVVQADDREQGVVGDGGERMAPGASALAVESSAASAEKPEDNSEASIIRPRSTAELPTPAELYSRAPRGQALRAERIQLAERALGLELLSHPAAPIPSTAPVEAEEAELAVMAQLDAPSDDLPAPRPAEDLPADEADDADQDEKPAVVDLSAITPTTVVTPQVSTVGATSSSIGGGAVLSEPASVPEPATESTVTDRTVAGPRAPQSLATTDQPGSVGPRTQPEPAGVAAPTTATTQTRRRARTALHSAAAQAAASMVTDSPYRNALSGQDRFKAPSGDIAVLDQGLDRVSETLSVIPGLRLENVAVAAGFSSNGIANPRNSLISVGSDYDFGASASVGYVKNWRRTNFRMGYSPSYSRRARFQEWNSTDHRMRLSVGRQLSRRWTVGSAASATNSGLESFWLELPVLRQVENPPTTFDELFRMAESGELTDDEFASVLTGTPVVEEEGGQGLDLSRVLNVSASANASYAYSPRLSFSVGSSLSDTQLLRDPLIGRRIDPVGRGNINDLRRAAFNGGMSYSLNRRTSLNAGYARSQMLSSFRSNDTQNGSVGVSHRIGRSWNLGGSVGVGQASWGEVRDPEFESSGFYQLPNGSRPTWTANGNLSYRLRAHRFQVQAGRTVGDSFGLGSFASMNLGAGWGWTTRDALWSASASASYSKSTNGSQLADGFGDTSVLLKSVGGGISRRLSSTTAVQTSYYFGEFDSPFRGLFVNNSVHRVQASFVWSPAQLR